MSGTLMRAPAASPMASNVVPFATTWPPPSGFPAGCCPPGGMDALMQCYCDIQAAKNFIGKIVLDLMQTDPAFAQAMVQAIADSGAALPLIGVTNGVTAQPGQVGEYFEISAGFQYAGTGTTTQQLTLGVLQPGDWDCWMWATFGNASVTGASFFLTPAPAGLAFDLQAAIYSSGSPEGVILSTMASQLITAVPVLIAASAGVTGSGTAGAMTVYFAARRRR